MKKEQIGFHGSLSFFFVHLLVILCHPFHHLTALHSFTDGAKVRPTSFRAKRQRDPTVAIGSRLDLQVKQRRREISTMTTLIINSQKADNNGRWQSEWM